MRLTDYGHSIGLIDDLRYSKFLDKKADIVKLLDDLQAYKVTPADNDYLISIGTKSILDGTSLYNLLKRPEVDIYDLANKFSLEYSDVVLEEVSIMIKYDGYITKAKAEAEKMRDLESKLIPANIDYDDMHNLASEAKQKLKEVRPTSIGQAMRISGVNPADISVLMIYLKRGMH